MTPVLPAWVGTLTVRMTAGAGGRRNSAVVHPPPLLHPRLRRPAAESPAVGVGSPVVGVVLAPETEG